MTDRPPLAEALDLEPHPEGGWFRQTFAPSETVTLTDGRAGTPADGDVLVVGTGDGELTQALVPGGTWQRTLPGDADALVSCLVTPGFDFEDFELA